MIALHPGLAWVAMLAPMPVFFAAAGWANATTTAASTARRLRALVGVAATVVGAWSLATLVEVAVIGEQGVVADGGRIATQPLWFLAVYVPATALTGHLARLARRPVVAVGGALSVLVALDVGRFALDAPEWIGWLSFPLAWGGPWLLGTAWRRAHPIGHEARAGAWLAVVGAAAAVALVATAGYFPSLVDAVDGERSNTTPPTLFTAIAAVTQVGLMLVVARRLDQVAARHRDLFDRAGEAAVGIYAWHLTALALCAAPLAAGLWAPTRFSTAWWITRPPWLVCVLGVTSPFVAATAWVRRRGAGRERRPSRRSPAAVGRTGVALATVGAAAAGRWGPRTIAGGVLSVVGLVGGWWCLRAAVDADEAQA